MTENEAQSAPNEYLFSPEEGEWETISALGWPVIPGEFPDGFAFTITEIHFGCNERDIRARRFLERCGDD